MTLKDLLIELAVEILGVSKDALMKNMLEYEKSIESNDLIYKELSPDKVQAFRQLVRSDPALFFKWAGDGFTIVRKRSTLH